MPIGHDAERTRWRIVESELAWPLHVEASRLLLAARVHLLETPLQVGDAVEIGIDALHRLSLLLADERRWCRGSFARGWREIPVPVRSVLGAIMRAGRKLGLRFEDAANALEWQTRRPVPNWNDDPWRTHAEVIAAFDGAIAALK